jgi:hypothetical protein
MFDRAFYAPFTGKILRIGGEAYAVVRCAAKGADASAARITAVLFDKLKRETIPVPLDIAERTAAGGLATFLVRFMIPELEPDTYTFVLTAESSAGSESSVVSMDVTLERGEGSDRDAKPS